jgi:cysteinyl-tRNA synthetase
VFLVSVHLIVGLLALNLTRALAAAADKSSVPASFAYVLQADALAANKAAAVEQLAACARDWIILDAFYTAGDPWDRADLERIRSGKGYRKVIAYLSIGEAEDYRPYWRKEWVNRGRLTPAAPSWLATQNPEWKGNYRVKYWMPGWQQLILAAIDEVMAQGFDGVYLDIVDGFETFEQDGKEFIANRLNPSTRQTFRKDMVDWVKLISTRARRENHDALIIAQNGSELLTHEDFLSAISAMGIEDLFTNGDKRQSRSHSREVLSSLERMFDAHKPVLLIEYPKREELRAMSKKLAAESGMTWLLTDRQLKTLGFSGK